MTSHMMMSVLDCAKQSFDHDFDGGCAATHGVDDSWSAPVEDCRHCSLPRSRLLQYGGTRSLLRCPKLCFRQRHM